MLCHSWVTFYIFYGYLKPIRNKQIQSYPNHELVCTAIPKPWVYGLKRSGFPEKDPQKLNARDQISYPLSHKEGYERDPILLYWRPRINKQHEGVSLITALHYSPKPYIVTVVCTRPLFVLSTKALVSSGLDLGARNASINAHQLKPIEDLESPAGSPALVCADFQAFVSRLASRHRNGTIGAFLISTYTICWGVP